MTHTVAAIGLASLVVMGAGEICGQIYPGKPIRIVTAAAGGGVDFAARLIAQGVAGPLGQPVIVDNRAGVTQVEIVAKAPTDGYTLLVAGGSFWIAPLLQQTSYDPVRDFSAVAMIVREVNVLATHPSLPAKSVKELIALARAKPGTLNYSSGPTGAPNHLATELFKHMAGVNIVRIAYKGGGPALIGLLGGEVQMLITDSGVLPTHVKSGRLNALAVTTTEPSALAPGLPTVSASGLPGFESVTMSGVFAPAKTPTAAINRLNQEIVRYLALPEAKERAASGGAEVVGGTPEQSAAKIKSEVDKWGNLIRVAGITKQ